MNFVADFVRQLRDRAADRDREGANTARTYTVVAEELERSFNSYLDEELDMKTAMAESGYGDERLRELMKEGKLTRLCRRQLPRKPGHGLPKPQGTTGTLDRAMGSR